MLAIMISTVSFSHVNLKLHLSVDVMSNVLECYFFDVCKFLVALKRAEFGKVRRLRHAHHGYGGRVGCPWA